MPSRWKLVTYGLIIFMGFLFALPNVLTPAQRAALPAWLPHEAVALGLDLRGGAHLVLEIDAAALRRDMTDSILEDVKQQLQQARVGGVRVAAEDGAVTLRATDREQLVAAERLLRADAQTFQIERTPDSALRIVLSDAAVVERERSAIEQSIEIVRRRIDAVGVAEPTVQQLGSQRILVQLPGVQDPKEIRTLLGSTAKLTFHRVRSDAMASTVAPPGHMRLPDMSNGSYYIVERRPMLQGERLVQAGAGFDSLEGGPVVSFRFDDLGARIFAGITTQNVGQRFAIVLDGKVLSAPVIREPITGGAGQISGTFTSAEASSLAALLRAGALPVPLQIIEERTVGPDLGSDAIRLGALTGVIGLLFVLGFMTVLYGAWGIVANLALVINVTLTLAALTLLGATLTLPGIAGIVLGIGLAVDANVLINERIREETRKGRAAAAALEHGFRMGYATILDSNVTTLIATVLLFWVGSGPVRGFAITMAFGIAISMFTAVAFVRALMGVWVRLRRPKQFLIGSLLPKRLLGMTPKFAFMRARYVGLGMSLVLSVASLLLFFRPGLNYGVDFTGGSILQVSAPQTIELSEMRVALENAEMGEVTLQQMHDSNSILVRIQKHADEDAVLQTERAKATILAVQPDAQFERVDIVGPKISSELADAGILAVLLASVAMLIYIWVRFEWHFAIGAIVTLVLDVTKMIGFFALTGIEFNLTAIAALLTLIGYSVNDKVVVYDRMRENLGLYPAEPLRNLIDRSINETLARSLYTSATAFLAMLPMAIWGGASVQSFAVPMTFGIVIAASSSVFIAAPILLFLGDWRKRRPARRVDPGLSMMEKAP
jgi:SecD/SecF fusion protein